MDDTLPQRPCVVPDLRILRRGPDRVQVGLDPRLATVVAGIPEPVAAALHRMNGHQDLDELLADLGEHRGAMRAALLALAERGMVRDASRQEVPLPGRLAGDQASSAMRAVTEPGRRDDPAGRRGLAVVVHGDGRLAVAVGTLLAAAGIGWVQVAAAGSVRPEDVGTGYQVEDIGRRRATAAREAIARVDAGVRTTTPRAGRAPDLVVLADSLVYEPARVAALNTAGVPHLTVRMRDGVGIVGPFVVPGLTSCLQCADLQRCDRDEHWPRIAVQLAGQVQLADLASTQATAAFAVSQALDAMRWLRRAGPAPTTCEATVELDLSSANVRHRAWPVHPSCSCDAAHRCPDVPAHSDVELRQSTT